MTIPETTIEKSILIRAPRTKVWRALTNLQQFAQWFRVEASGEFAPGVRLDMVSTHPCGEGAKFWLTVEALEPRDPVLLALATGSKPAGANYDADPTTLVEFRLEDAEGGTLVTVVESGFDRLSLARRAKAFEDNTNGWEIQLAALNAYAG